MSTAPPERLSRLRSRIPEAGLEALLVTHLANVRYLSGFTGSAGALLITPAEAVLISDGRYQLQAQQEAPDWRFVLVQDSQLAAIAQVAAELGLRNLGFEAPRVTFSQHEELAAQLGDTSLEPTKQMVEDLRECKEEAEIGLIRQSLQITEACLEHLLGLLRPGAVEGELALEAEVFMRRHGAEGLAFEYPIVASGQRGALPHAHPTEKAIAMGDLVVIDIGARKGGYCSDLTRTVCVGEASEEQRRIYRLVRQAQEAGREAVRAGAVVGEVDAAARAVITEAGCGEYFTHSLGHGVGLEVHEAPRLAKSQQAALSAGAVVTVEPGIYLPDLGGVRIEDMVVVRADGAETLTRAPNPQELPVL